MSDYNYTLELEPHNEGALFNRGLLRYEVKDLDRAAADFKEVLRMSPDNFHALYNMGLVELERSKPKEALGYFRRIADRYPRFYPVYYAQAEALRDMGDMRAAMQNVRTADKLVKRYVKNPEKNPLDRPAVQAGRANSSGDGSPENEMSDTEVMDRFNQLVTVGSASRTSLSYNEKSRGESRTATSRWNPNPPTPSRSLPAQHHLSRHPTISANSTTSTSGSISASAYGSRQASRSPAEPRAWRKSSAWPTTMSRPSHVPTPVRPTSSRSAWPAPC